MSAPLKIDVITIFPGMLEGFLGESMVKRASDAGLVAIRTINLRDYTSDNHRTVDDRPYGGGPGMVMKAEPLFKAVEAVASSESRVILTCPQGHPFSQGTARELSEEKHLVIICGHYEGVDERVREALVTDEISIGDYVLTNGVIPAAVIIDAVTRLLPGALGGGAEATEMESFGPLGLEYPQFTRPSEFRGMRVPDILSSGDHEAIARWRAERAAERTRQRRPDLLTDAKSGNPNASQNALNPPISPLDAAP